MTKLQKQEKNQMQTQIKQIRSIPEKLESIIEGKKMSECQLERVDTSTSRTDLANWKSSDVQTFIDEDDESLLSQRYLVKMQPKQYFWN
ncbi:hypothetical protein GLOIN_2v1848400 [Rhizophagus clarus]|uniref:Uncharacterized protein n=1 Tax=Rhizophagus clarus TaxID=94130 RepID=A0A8H3QSN0_9GLOM|nr:hypothetical protein GLOIN_2v1848400 [Rhizophagus clarus]